MKKMMLGLLAGALVVSAQPVLAVQYQRKDLQVLNDISTTVNRYAFFTIFDDVSAKIDEGVVTLSGKVTMPYKRNDIARRVAGLAGVTKVINTIDVLPASRFDDEIRHRVARSIYGNPSFWNYAVMAASPIHIVVEHGRVTLTGVVHSEVDKALARSLALQSGVMSVKVDLLTPSEAREQLEKS
jgi:osmotically-inducible protein OsmY